MVILLGIATAVARIFAVRQDRRGLFISMFFNSNTIFVGLPINQTLSGMPVFLMFWSITCVILPFSGLWGPTWSSEMAKEKLSLISKRVWKSLSPPPHGLSLRVSLGDSSYQAPLPFSQWFAVSGQFNNSFIHDIYWFISVQCRTKTADSEKDQFLILLGRFVVAPLLMATIVYWAPLPSLMKQVFIIQSAMPVMTNAPVVAKLYGADSDYAAIMGDRDDPCNHGGDPYSHAVDGLTNRGLQSSSFWKLELFL